MSAEAESVCPICQNPPQLAARFSAACAHQGCLGCVERLRRASWRNLDTVPRLNDQMEYVEKVEFAGACPLCRAPVAPPPTPLALVNVPNPVSDRTPCTCDMCEQPFGNVMDLVRHAPTRCTGRYAPCPFCHQPFCVFRRSMPETLRHHVNDNFCTAVECKGCGRTGTRAVIGACEQRHQSLRDARLALLRARVLTEQMEQTDAVDTLTGIADSLDEFEHSVAPPIAALDVSDLAMGEHDHDALLRHINTEFARFARQMLTREVQPPVSMDQRRRFLLTLLLNSGQRASRHGPWLVAALE